MVKEDIETVIDRLLAYVQANNAVSLNDAAKAMALPETQVEKLALLLEEEGLVNMKYSLTSTKIVSKEFTESQAAKAKEKLAVRPDAVVSESEEAEREVMTAETLLSFIERDITRRLQEAERRLLSLEAKEAYSPEEYKQLEKELRIILQQAAMEYALEGDKAVGDAHLKRVAAPALRHRLRRNPLDEAVATTRVERAVLEQFAA